MTTGTLINNFSDNVKELCCTISGIVKNKIVTPVSHPRFIKYICNNNNNCYNQVCLTQQYLFFFISEHLFSSLPMLNIFFSTLLHMYCVIRETN